jgi:hypothetical protein
MTSTNGLAGLPAALAGLALALAGAGPGNGQPAKRRAVEVMVFNDKGYFGPIARDGDHFVAVRFRTGEKGARIRNFEVSGGFLRVGDRYLGYDLSGKSKDVLALEWPGKDTRAIRWEAVRDRKSGVRKHLRVANGALKGWWIGLAPAEPAKGGGRPQARLVLVKDQKDAATFDWTRPEDEWSP